MTTRVEFPNHDGQLLAAALELPVGSVRAFAIFAHCFTCTKDSAAAARVSRGLCARGIAVLRFDFTGLGGSGGDFGNTGFSSNLSDLIAAAEWLRHAHSPPSLLVGHSLGGAAVLRAAACLPEVRAVATIGAPADPAHVLGLLGDSIEEIRTKGEARLTLGGRPFQISRQFIEDLDEPRMLEDLQGLRCAKIVLHSPNDRIVSIDNAARIYGALLHPKSFVSLDDADHLLSRREDADYVAEILASWVSRYLPELADEQPDEGTVVVDQRAGGFETAIRAGRHELIADEPAGVGGKNLGPSPYDLLLSALGACTAMTLHMYARHKKLSLDRVVVTLRHHRIHAKDCSSCETSEGQVDRIERSIRLEGDLPGDVRQRLGEIADRCPVHRTLMRDKEIVTTIEP